MLAVRRSAAAAAAAARLATRPPQSARGCRTCSSSAAAAGSANRAAQRVRGAVLGTNYYLARSAPAVGRSHHRRRRLGHLRLQQPLSTLRGAGGEGSGCGEPPKSTGGLEWGRRGWTGAVGGGQGGVEKESPGVAAHATPLGSGQRMMAKRRHGSASTPSRGGGGKGTTGNRGIHSPAGGGGPANTGGSGRIVTATNAIIAVNVAAYMMQVQDPSFTTSYYKLAYSITDQGEWFRLVTSMALHGGWAHLLCNNLSLFSIGPTMEHLLGTKRFVALYACSGVAGNVLSCVVHPLTPSLGASGAIFGVLGAGAVLKLVGPGASVKGFVESIASTAFFALGVAILVPNIDHMGHLGGFLGGAMVTLLLRPRSPSLT